MSRGLRRRSGGPPSGARGIASTGGGWRAAVLGLIPGGFVLGGGVFMAAEQGGYSPTVWYPAGLLLVAFLGMLAVAAWSYGRPTRPVLLVLAAFGGFTAWSYASIAWAAARADAWDGANRTLVYLLALSAVALWPVGLRSAWLLIFGFVVAATVLGVTNAILLVHSGNVDRYTIGGRLSAPFGYPNANAAFFMVAAWCALGLSSRRWLRPPVRGCAVGLGVVLVGLNLLTASRGSLFTVPAVALTYLILVPGRLRSLAMSAVILVGVAPVIGPALGVYQAEAAAVPREAGHALVLMLVAGSAAAAAGAILALVDERMHVTQARVRTIGWIVATLIAVGGIGAALQTQTWSRIPAAWHSFRYGGEPGGATHFGGLGSNRYDFWRVGLVEFKRHPLVGIGADNFLVPYMQRRRSTETPLYPHSLWVRLVSQLGLIGTALFCGVLVLATRAVSRTSGTGRELAGIAFVGFSVWIWHGLVDWLWEMPALGIVAMGLLGIALAVESTAGGARRLPSGRWMLGGLSVLAVLAVGTLTLPWLSERDVRHAGSIWTQSPSGAFNELARARDLNPLSNRADLVAGAIAARLGRYEAMRDAYARAAMRFPADWYAQFELGVAEALTGDRSAAAAAFARAVERNPHDPIVRGVIARFRAHAHLNPVAIDQALSG
jgi:hypothetical protein